MITAPRPGERRGEHWPVIVIGGGPAGCAAAIAVARAGVRVLLVERAREGGARMPGGGKVCGGCLNAAALRELAGLDGAAGGGRDAAAALRRLGEPLHVVRLVAGGRTAVLPMGGSVAIGRDELDPWLRAKARSAGVVLRQGVSAEVLDPGAAASGQVVVVSLRAVGDGDASPCTADWVIAADGLAGTALRHLPASERSRRRGLPGQRIGIGTILDWPPELGVPPRGELMMIDGDRGYLGLVRLQGDRVDLAAAVDPAAVAAAGGPRRWLARTLESAGMPGEAVAGDEAGDGLRVRGTPRLATRAVRPTTGGVVRAGDGLEYAEPFSGQGIAWALESGRRAGALLASVAGEPLVRQRAAVSRAWERAARRQHRRQRACRLLAGGLRTPIGGAVLTRLADLVPTAARAGLRWIDRDPAGGARAGDAGDRRLGIAP